MKKLLILGAGGHGKVVLELALICIQWDEIAFLDDTKVGRYVLGYPVVGGIEDLDDFKGKFTHAIVALGDNSTRLRLTDKLILLGFCVPTFIHPSAIISSFSILGRGTVVLANSVINTNSEIGNACIINTSSLIEHDCQVKNGVHVSPGALIAGNVIIGERTWICLGAKVINSIKITNDVVIGAGAVVVRDICVSGVYFGIPAKRGGKKF